MSRYSKSLAMLNSLIAELEANTGGETFLPEDCIGKELPSNKQK